MNVLLAIQKPSKHDRFVFNCILYNGNFSGGIIKSKEIKTIYNNQILDSLDLMDQLQEKLRAWFELDKKDEILIILGQRYNGYTFWEK